MAIVRHQRAIVALGQIELAAHVAVVDEQHHARGERTGHAWIQYGSCGNNSER
jgi:hypothetical protein